MELKYMIFLLAILLCFCIAKSGETDTRKEEFLAKIAKTQFNAFKLKYKKTYKSQDEEDLRLNIFRKNLEKIAKMNVESKGGNNFSITQFSDLTEEEFSHMYLMPKRNKPEIAESSVLKVNYTGVKAPAEWDWRKNGLVNGVSCITPVKNQGQCGSCWAFSATEQIESMNFLEKYSGAKPKLLSVQQIVDCDKKSAGCDGGWTYYAYEYVKSAGGQDSVESYPYEAKDGACRFKKPDVEAKVESWSYVTRDEDETTMRNFVGTTGPLSICVDASSWQFYNGGVLKSCGKQLDHCVQIVGYTKADGVEAWIVRNSWGESWGMKGYILLEYGKDMCGLAQVATTIKGAAL